MIDLCSKFTAYFLKSSPDFVNSRGQVFDAAQQVQALGESQGIGVSFLSACLFIPLIINSSVSLHFHYPMLQCALNFFLMLVQS